MEQTTPRVFTRADVEQFFQKHYGFLDYPKCELESISLLSELLPPTWRVRYKCTYLDGDVLYFNLIVAQFDSAVGPFLNLVTEVELPAGLASAAEEDAELKRREEADKTA